MTTVKQMVLLTSNPNKTAHAQNVVSELFRGTFVECEAHEIETNQTGFIWLASNWDHFKGAK